ncbi:MAG: ferrochelatase [Rhodobacteraceae bacterium]|nr:ferrochelatase [Paracoccaceae bacterium]
MDGILKDQLIEPGSCLDPSRRFDKVGVIVTNLGTPDAPDYWPMRRYLGQFLSDPRVIDYSPWLWQPLLQLVILSKRPFSSGAAYAGIWNKEKNESPLLTITRNQTDNLRKRLKVAWGDDVEVEFAMRYGNPSTPSVIEKMKQLGCDRLIFFPLYPQYSAATTGTANDEAFRKLITMRWQPSIRTVPPYCKHPGYIAALKSSVEKAYSRIDTRPDVLVASYHGLPERYANSGDPYCCMCHDTSDLLRTSLGMTEDELITTFQSKFGPEAWLKPYTVEEVARLAEAGKKNIAIMAPAFSADCIETLEEINEEIKESFEEAGGETFTYIPCLNDDEMHIDMMADIVRREAAGWL